MKELKGYVKNRLKPEGCIVEKYLAKECSRFCSGYMKQAVEICVQCSSNEDMEDQNIVKGHPIGQGKLKILSSNLLEIAHGYV